MVAPKPSHGWVIAELMGDLVPYLRRHRPDGYWGTEIDIPTILLHGRGPDFLYYSPEARLRIDRQSDEVLGVPTLAVEVVSASDEVRDLVTKRAEYARAGIEHYWIFDPNRKSALLLKLGEHEYTVVSEFGVTDTLTSGLCSVLEVPLARLFE